MPDRIDARKVAVASCPKCGSAIYSETLSLIAGYRLYLEPIGEADEGWLAIATHHPQSPHGSGKTIRDAVAECVARIEGRL